MSKLPFMQFYPADWLQDVQVLTLEAQGAWIKLLCAMWVAPERGKIIWGYREFETFWGRSKDATELLIDDLSAVADVSLRDSDDNIAENHDNAVEITIISRRMVREEIKRKQGLEADKRYREGKTSEKRPKNVVKTSPIYQKSEVRSHILKSKRATQFPDNFSVSEEIKAWAHDHGLPDPASELPAFRDYHNSKGSTFRDWDAALRTWLRNSKKFNGHSKPAPELAHSTTPPYKPRPTDRRADPAIRDGLKQLVSDLSAKMSIIKDGEDIPI